MTNKLEKYINKPFSIGGKILLEGFKELPDRAQELIFSYLSNPLSDISPHFFNIAAAFDVSDLESPIEKIFYIADSIYSFETERQFVSIFPQVEIDCKGKVYRVDFLYDNTEDKEICEHKGIPVPDVDIKIVVECDGHNFHQKNKQQVKRDNERQIALQLAGYDVIRFSGSQIYENPIKCVEQVYNLAEMKLGGVNGA